MPALTRSTTRTSPLWRPLGDVIAGIGLFVLVVGVVSGGEAQVAAGTFMFSVGYVLKDYFKRSSDDLGPMTFYVASAGIFFGLANFVAFRAVGTEYDLMFNRWGVPRFNFQAQLIAALGVVVPPIGYLLANRIRRMSPVTVLPAVGFNVPDRALFGSVIALATSSWVFRMAGINEAALGTLSALIALGPNVAIFILALRLAGPQGLTRVWKWVLAVLLVYLTIDQLLFAYLRIAALWPSLSFFTAYTLRRRVMRRHVAALAAIMVAFMVFLQPLGDLRQERIVGRDRWDRLVVDARVSSEGITAGVMQFLARLSTSSQLSQVSRLVDEDGMLGGETISYAFFVFIPRAIWPDKPLIVPGQWFAERIGRGQRLDEDRFSNAINMTVPGELFLNFGWLGAIAGLLLYGAIMSVTWHATILDGQYRNPIGQAMGYMILLQAISVGSHMGAVFNLLLWYVLMLALTFPMALVTGTSPQQDANGGAGQRTRTAPRARLAARP